MKQVNISFTSEQLQIISEGLVNLPFKISAPLISYINLEIQKQFDASRSEELTEQTIAKDEFSGT
jgi:hypothetical protein